jgi:hypothetical protein
MCLDQKKCSGMANKKLEDYVGIRWCLCEDSVLLVEIRPGQEL